MPLFLPGGDDGGDGLELVRGSGVFQLDVPEHGGRGLAVGKQDVAIVFPTSRDFSRAERFEPQAQA